jgi:hypothetical protein
MELKMNSGSVRATVALLAAVGCGSLLLAQKSPTAGSPDAAIVHEFEGKVKQYVEFRRNTVGHAPTSTNNAGDIVSAQREMADKVRVARAGAKQGEIFDPRVAQYFRKQIAASVAGPHGKQIRSSLKGAEPVNMELQINQSYPQNVPLQSTPPTVLMNLPELPDHLEYRLMNRELVLRDAEINLVVDYIPNALPESIK